MSDKIQHTANGLRERMLTRYGNELYHKHNKNHLQYRQHSRSHPCNLLLNHESETPNGSTGLVRQFKLKKIRKRLNDGRIH